MELSQVLAWAQPTRSDRIFKGYQSTTLNVQLTSTVFFNQRRSGRVVEANGYHIAQGTGISGVGPAEEKR